MRQKDSGGAIQVAMKGWQSNSAMGLLLAAIFALFRNVSQTAHKLHGTYFAPCK